MLQQESVLHVLYSMPWDDSQGEECCVARLSHKGNMMPNGTNAVADYLASLPADRREAIAAVRRAILKKLDRDFAEGMLYGMIAYYVPHRLYPAGYHCDPTKPLMFAALASQKNYMSLHMMSLYGSGEQLAWFKQAWAKAGKKLDMGKSCVRFKKLDDVALNVISEAVGRVSARTYIERCEALLKGNTKDSRSGKRLPAKKVAKKAAKPLSRRGKAQGG